MTDALTLGYTLVSLIIFKSGLSDHIRIANLLLEVLLLDLQTRTCLKLDLLESFSGVLLKVSLFLNLLI